MTPSRETFESASDIFLLQMIAEADDYTPAAIHMAREVLLSRGFTTSAITASVNTLLQNKKNAADKKEQVISSIVDPIAEMLEPKKEIGNTKLIKALKWYVGIVLAYSIFRFLWECWFVFQNESWAQLYSVLLVIPVLMNTLLFVLVVKQNKWGWRLILFSASFSLVMSFNSVTSNQDMIVQLGPSAWIKDAFGLVVAASLISLLLQQDLLLYFNQNRKTGWLTIAIGVGLALVMLLIQWLSMARVAPF